MGRDRPRPHPGVHSCGHHRFRIAIRLGIDEIHRRLEYHVEFLHRPPAFRSIEGDGILSLTGPGESEDARRQGLYLGIDFGFHNPFVCLWIWRDRFGRTLVIDEYVQSEREVDGHIEEIKSRQHGPVRKIGCDPAGSARNEQTGVSNVQKFRAAGFKVSFKASRIVDGLEMIRAGLRSGTGAATLFIHPRCKQLIQAMRAYRYGKGRDENPLKDGPDHLVDALRYYFVNRDGGEVEGRVY